MGKIKPPLLCMIGRYVSADGVAPIFYVKQTKTNICISTTIIPNTAINENIESYTFQAFLKTPPTCDMRLQMRGIITVLSLIIDISLRKIILVESFVYP